MMNIFVNVHEHLYNLPLLSHHTAPFSYRDVLRRYATRQQKAWFNRIPTSLCIPTQLSTCRVPILPNSATNGTRWNTIHKTSRIGRNTVVFFPIRIIVLDCGVIRDDSGCHLRKSEMAH